MKMTLRDFENINVFNYKNIERLVESFVNESSNAAFVSLFEDTVILYDHNESVFYKTDYKIHEDDLTVTFSNYEEIEFTEEENHSLKESVREFFENDEYDVDTVVKRYKENVISDKRILNEIINEALSKKGFTDTVNYKEIAEASKDLEIKKEAFFEDYTERLSTNPLSEVKYFNWKDPVIVSMYESTEDIKLINSNAAETAKALWKNKSFKEAFIENSKTLVDDVETAKEKFLTLFETYNGVFMLDAAEKKELFGKTILGVKELQENYKEILEGVRTLFNEDDFLAFEETLYEESEEPEEDDKEDDKEDEEEPKKDKKDKKKAKELTKADKKKIVSSLQKVMDKVEDEGAIKAIQKVIDKINPEEEGTKPEDIKEAVQILSF